MTQPSESERKLLDGRFEIESLLGSGGMADVFRATDLRHGRAVAVKVLRSDVLDTIGVERFRREIAVTAAFTHPHILALLESGETVGADGRHVLYYVMPLVAGETIRDRLAREGRFPLHDALRFTHEVLEALQYAHAQGVIHRDIKPANVLLSGGHAVVADFGIARPVPSASRGADNSLELTVSGVALGTPAYMSPEQAFGGQVIDARCDVYAVGCVLYEMLTGMPPFEANSGQAVMARKMNGAFVPPSVMRSGLPAVLDDIVARALRPDPADRFASATALLTALDVVSDPSMSASGMARLPAARPPWRRRGMVASTIAVPILALGAWALMHRGAGEPGQTATARADPARVAVLPFENLSADTSLVYVANGLTTDLIDELAQVRALTVVSKNGVLPFRAKSVGVDSVARALNVGSVITGDVRRSGDRVNVSVRLVDGRTGQQIVSHDTSGTLQDLLGVRSAVLDDVVQFLRERLGEQVRTAAERGLAHSAQAWELVERVRALADGELRQAYTMAHPARARRFQYADSLMVVAARLDKGWSAPLVQRATLANQQAAYEEVTGVGGESDKSAGIEAARRLWNDAVRRSDEALARDAGDASALRARGEARMNLWRTSRDAPGDTLRALSEADFRAAVDLRPDMSVAWVDLSDLLTLSGDFAQAEQAAAEALRADEYLLHAPEVLQNLQFTALGAEQTDNAARWCNEGRRRYPDDVRFIGCTLTTLGWTASRPADVRRAWDVLGAAERRYTDPLVLSSGWATRRLFIAAIAARAGMRDSALAIVTRTRAEMPNGASPIVADYNEARVRALLGQTDDALRLLDSYLTRFPIYRRQVARLPWFRSLRDDPRFIAMTATR